MFGIRIPPARGGRARAWVGVAAAACVAALGLATSLAGCNGGSNGAQASSTESPATTTVTVTGPSSGAGLEASFVDAVRAAQPSVVQVQTGNGLGSGVVYDKEGDIVTNAHVVGSSKRFQITDLSGRRYDGTLVGTFRVNDLAVVRVSGANLRPARFANSSKLEVGDIVLAVGNPLGFQSSVTQGIVSALDRTLTEATGFALADLIQTSAAINPGNSGGALVGLDGRVVGIPTLAAVNPETSQQATGIGFAIPSNTVKEIAGQLIKHGRVVRSNRAYLGVRLTTLQSGNGVVVASVQAGGPAARAGIRAGDAVTAVDGRPVRSIDDLAAVLANKKPGDQVRLGIRTASGATKTVTVTLGQFPGT